MKTVILMFSKPLAGSKNKISQQMQFYANVTDVAGNTVSGGTSVVVHQSEYYAGIRSERYIGRQGEATAFQRGRPRLGFPAHRRIKRSRWILSSGSGSACRKKTSRVNCNGSRR